MQSQATLFARFEGAVKKSEQSNNPVFTESTAPGSGNPPWQWDVSNIQGFAGGASFQFVSLGGDGTQARLEWSAIEDSDWTKAGGCEGTFDLRIFNNTDPDITYPGFQVSLRYLDSPGYTLFEHQKGGGSPLPADGHTYKFSAPAFEAGLPVDLALQFDGGVDVLGRGVVTDVSTAGPWTADKSCTLRIQDGTRPYSEIPSYPLSLRRLEAPGYTLFEHQKGGGSPLPADGHTYKFSAPAFEAGLPVDLALQFDGGVDVLGRGVVTDVSTAGPWTADKSCTLRIQDGTRPYSEIPSYPLSLRQVGHKLFYWFDNQTAPGTTTVNADPASGGSYAFGSTLASVSVTASGTVTNGAEVSSLSGASGTDEDFGVTIQDGTRPSSTVGATLNRRHAALDPDPIPFQSEASAPGDAVVKVKSTGTTDDTTIWKWGPGTPSGIASAISFPASTGSTAQLSWADGGLCPAGDNGALGFSLEPNDLSASPCQISLHVGVDAHAHLDIDVAAAAGHALAAGEENRPYADQLLTAVLPAGEILSTDTFDWELVSIAPATQPAATVFSLEQLTTPDPLRRNLHALGMIPDDWGGATQTFTVRVTQKRDGAAFNGGNAVGLTAAFADNRDDTDVAILLDRSGSMLSGSRWEAALSGAKQFADLVKEANGNKVPGLDPNRPNHAHRLGVYWFWGHDQYSFTGNGGDPEEHNYPNPSPALAGWPDGFYGNVKKGADDLGIDTGTALADPTKITSIGADNGPGHFTALGAGLLHCRDELVLKTDPTKDRKRLLLVLTDGMENRKPMISEVFDPGYDYYFKESPDPQVKIYSVALFTGASYVEKLKDLSEIAMGVSDGTDYVKEISDPSSDWAGSLHNWFVNAFSAEFGFTQTVAPADPALAAGASASHDVAVNSAQDKVMLYLLLEGADEADADWTLGLRSPSGAVTTRAVPNGARYTTGPFYKMFVLDRAAHAGDWSGTWKLDVRHVSGANQRYSIGALAHQDMTFARQVVAPAAPRPGDQATLRITLAGSAGPITDASVTADVRSPARWPGHDVSLEVGANTPLVKKARKAAGKEAKDVATVPDRVLRSMYAAGLIAGGRTQRHELAHAGGGVYEKTIALAVPGQHGIAFSASGARTDLGTGEPYTLEDRAQLSVRFLPAAKLSETGGYFADAGTLRLLVQPIGAKGVLLGPGWARAVSFRGPRRLGCSWPAADGGDGHYFAEIRIRSEGLRFDARKAILRADAMWLAHPALGEVSLRGASLPLDGFSAEVLGVRLPIRIWALVGDRRTKKVHLVSCPRAGRLTDRNLVWMHDLRDAQKHGYDTCEHCLPLICNASPKAMEAHRPFCAHAKRIKPENRLEVHGIEQALALGFDGCRYCLKKYNTR